MTSDWPQRIAFVRSHLAMSQTEMARLLGVSRSYLSEVERGGGKPSVAMLVGIATSLPAINLDWLLTGEGSPIRASGDGGRAVDPGDDVRRKAFERMPDLELPQSGETDQVDLGDIAWPLTSAQETMLKSYVPIPPAPGSTPFANPFSSKFDHWRETNFPYALSRLMVSKLCSCPSDHVFVYHFRDDRFSPFIPQGSHGIICGKDDSIDGPGLYWVDDDGPAIWLVSGQEGARVRGAVGNPTIPGNIFERDLAHDSISVIGRIVWLGLAPLSIVNSMIEHF